MLIPELNRRLFMGLVESVKDPNRKGRIKVRVQGLYDEIPLEDIPYAYPYGSINGRGFCLPDVGKIVNIFYPNCDLYEPYYIFAEEMNINLQEKLKEYSDEDYANFVALTFDNITQIYYDVNNLTLDYKFNKMTIDNDSINHELKDNSQIMNIGSKGADQPALMTIHFFDWMDRFMKKLLEPNSMTGNLGAPVVKPELDALITEYNAIRKTFLSDNIFIVDNNKIRKLS